MNHVTPDLKFSSITGHPKSAPFKAETEEKSSIGLSIPYINHDDEFLKQKKLQNLAYYQELTRQIQEKKINQVAEQVEGVTNELSFSPERTLPTKYLKKHEIENHASLARYNGQLFGGVLQRDEAAINKIKRKEQQRELVCVLSSQIQERKSKAEEEKNKKTANFSEDLLSLAKNLNEFPQFSPIRKVEECNKPKPCITESEKQSFSRSKTLPDEVEINNIKKLFDQVSKEKEQLINIYESKQSQIKDLMIERSHNVGVQNIHRIQGNPLKVQKNEDKRSIVKKQEFNQNQMKSPNRVGKFFKYPSEVGSLVSPLPKTPDTEQESVRMEKNLESSRHNLDTAGKSCFIYPDSQGNFDDGIDRFLLDYGNGGDGFRKSEPAKYDKLASSSICFAPRKNDKPTIARRAGFPSDFFRGTGKK